MTALEHGVYSTYTYRGCRCGECRHAAMTARKQWRLRSHENGGPLLVDSTGTVRRVQALMVMGWPIRVIAEAAGVRPSVLRTFVYTPGDTINTARADAIRAVFDRLCMTPGPAKATATRARRKGWAPPLSWNNIDDPAEQPKGIAA